MNQTFTVPGRLMGRNEAEGLARAHWAKAARARKEEKELVEACIRAAKLVPSESPVDVSIIYCEKLRFYKNGKMVKPRDADNVQIGGKAILDALVACGIVPDDGPEWVRRVIPIVKYTAGEGHVTVAVMDYEPHRVVEYPPVEFEKGERWKE